MGQGVTLPFDVLFGTALRPATGFQSCGDGIFISSEGSPQLFVLVDALGHGPEAAKNAKMICDVCQESPSLPLPNLFLAASKKLTGERGAVMSAIRIENGEVAFAGIGNVDIFAPPGVRRPACRPGTIGRGTPRVREEVLEAKGGQRWVLATDGIRARDVRRVLEEIATMDAATAAKELIARASRLDDDAGVVVIDFKERA
jgi:negative regulator of sigma-B (phosphoserine phosphatase)